MTTLRPDLPPLKTPLTAPLLGHYPSELRSPAVGTPTYIKREDALRTPITPPAAYLDFLSKMSPTVTSPQSAFASSKFFSFEKPPLTSTVSSESITSNSSLSSFSSGSSLATIKTLDSDEAGSPPVQAARAVDAAVNSESSSDTESSRKAISESPASQPSAIIVDPSLKHTSVVGSCAHTISQPTSQPSASVAPAVQPVQPQLSQLCPPPPTPTNPAGYSSAAPIHPPPPPSPFNRPQPARTPRRLYIPQSPYTPGSVRSPLSATGTLYSPFTATMSPREWESLERVGGIPLSAGGNLASSAASSSAMAAATASAAGNAVNNGRAIVRQVITRTVTYATRAPAQAPIVEPVPKWKKRKVGP